MYQGQQMAKLTSPPMEEKTTIVFRPPAAIHRRGNWILRPKHQNGEGAKRLNTNHALLSERNKNYTRYTIEESGEIAAAVYRFL